jgi:hypothetical protein
MRKQRCFVQCPTHVLISQARANSYVNDIKRSPEAWGLCVERFSVTAYSEVKFWCLQTLHEVILVGWPHKQSLMHSVYSLFPLLSSLNSSHSLPALPHLTHAGYPYILQHAARHCKGHGEIRTHASLLVQLCLVLLGCAHARCQQQCF